MSIFSIVIIALALAMDAFAVSISSGIAITKLHVRHAMLIACCFGSFQGLMPLIGWGAGQGIKVYIACCDHWIAFILLFIVGARMIYDACREQDEEKSFDPLNKYVLFVLSIATSIDALAVGLTLSFINVSIMLPALIIGVVTFVMSFAGAYIGAMFGHLLEKRVEIAGGLLLIGIGVKILVQHLLEG
ncbi:manganese efflux pump [Candidatus Sumerlaeota bacterium]|nr:manganese efflux pump [Candidatus Sumerlaeota bacterium]